MNEFNENFMREAIKQAKKAWAIGETPEAIINGRLKKIA